MPITWDGDVKKFDGMVMEMYPVGCCENGCNSCCANGLLCFMSCGTYVCCAPSFTFYLSADGKRMVGKDATFAGCLKISPIPCFQGCGVGPCAFQSPGSFTEIEGGLKWTGDGQIVAGGCCPCLTNAGDWNTVTAANDGSSPDKYGEFYPSAPADLDLPLSLSAPPPMRAFCRASCGSAHSRARWIETRLPAPPQCRWRGHRV